MPIKPIDTLTMPNRSQEASQVHHSSNERQAYVQEQLGTQFKHDVAHQLHKTTKKEKPENKEERYDAKEKGHGTYHGRQGKRQGKGEEGEQKEIRTSGFDIRI